MRPLSAILDGMRSPAYQWDHFPDTSFLRFNMRQVAYLVRDSADKWPHTIWWQGKQYRATAGSREQAIRWVSAWIDARGGELPVFPIRRTRR